MTYQAFGFIRFFHSLCGSSSAGRAQALGACWMKGDEDGSILHVFLWRVCCVSGVLGCVV